MKIFAALVVAGAGVLFGLAWDLFGYRRGSEPE